ncbi:hypothetical protein [Brachybacterium hainanense]|uniref:MBL fold metallo-hydrolase n=1 Tax=Brachybacterium hainanense TaxID=1541174 RepID=A0ABV6RC82_9MICO
MDTRSFSATITHTHDGVAYIIDGPVPTVPDEDSPTAEDLAHDVRRR